jgi:hypothetical protein
MSAAIGSVGEVEVEMTVRVIKSDGTITTAMPVEHQVDAYSVIEGLKLQRTEIVNELKQLQSQLDETVKELEQLQSLINRISTGEI